MKQHLNHLFSFGIFFILTCCTTAKPPSLENSSSLNENGHAGKIGSERCISLKSEAHAQSIYSNEFEHGSEIIFFASWCQTCAEKLRGLKNSKKKVWVVGVFDTKKAVEKTLRFFQVTSPCYFDEKEYLAKKLGVTSVPAVKTVSHYN